MRQRPCSTGSAHRRSIKVAAEMAAVVARALAMADQVQEGWWRIPDFAKARAVKDCCARYTRYTVEHAHVLPKPSNARASFEGKLKQSLGSGGFLYVVQESTDACPPTCILDYRQVVGLFKELRCAAGSQRRQTYVQAVEVERVKCDGQETTHLMERWKHKAEFRKSLTHPR